MLARMSSTSVRRPRALRAKNPTKFSIWLRKQRKDRKLTQPDVAAIVGRRNYTTVLRWEQGRECPGVDALAILAARWGASLDDLVKWSR